MTELKAFLGLFQFDSRYLPNVADKLGPQYRLLRKGVPWKWKTGHCLAFQQVKESLQTNHILVLYDPKNKLILTCDACQYGVGAVLSHIMPNGSEKPVACASRTLSATEKITAEKNYQWIKKNPTNTCLDGLSISLQIISHSSVFSARQGLSSIACHQKLSDSPY